MPKPRRKPKPREDNIEVTPEIMTGSPVPIDSPLTLKEENVCTKLKRKNKDITMEIAPKKTGNLVSFPDPKTDTLFS